MRWIALLVALCGVAGANEEWIPLERSGQPVATGARLRVNVVRRGWAPDGGLVALGDYARAVEADAAGRHIDAVAAYAAALAGLGDGLDSIGELGQCLPAWRARAAWQRETSERLLEQTAYVTVVPRAFLAHFALARTTHAKFLAVRAFLGRGPRGLWVRARDGYLRALELEPGYAPARLGLAALYAAAGMEAEARSMRSAVSPKREGDALARYEAEYLAAIGDDEGAFRELARAVTNTDARREALRGSAFDRLRADRRWRALFPAEEPLLRDCRHPADGL